jgi:hypothetical protein
VKAFATYEEARAEAQRLADELGMDVGVEAPSEFCRPGVTRLPEYFRTWNVRLLPGPKFRQGWELRCEVVHPATWRGE